MTEAEWDEITARVFATPAGKVWLEAMATRSEAPTSFLLAEIKARILRMRERWRTGELTPQ